MSTQAMTTDERPEVLHRTGALARQHGLHPSAISRFVLKGVTLPDGSRLRLEAARIGGRWLVRQSDWEQFVQDQTAARLGDDDRPADTPRSPGKRRAASERADAELQRLGF